MQTRIGSYRARTHRGMISHVSRNGADSVTLHVAHEDPGQKNLTITVGPTDDELGLLACYTRRLVEMCESHGIDWRTDKVKP